ncbi:MAG: hypothetical protein ACI9MK_001896, partial [Oceanospirillaceae bacterium]
MSNALAKKLLAVPLSNNYHEAVWPYEWIGSGD